MQLLTLSASELAGLIPMSAASEAMKQAFAALSSGAANAPPRVHVDVPGPAGKTLLMGAYLPGSGLASKIVSYFPQNRERGLPAIHGIVVVLDEDTGVPVALCDGTSLTALRTGAATAASIELLARPGASVGVLIGTGGQAAMQLVALDSARPLARITVVARDRERGEAFVRRLQPTVKARLECATAPEPAVRDADIVVAATSSFTPVFAGRHLKTGCHVVAIGSIRPEMEEVDEETVSRARIFVDSRQGVLSEAGELIQGVQRGLTRVEDWTELGEVALGLAPGRQNEHELTFFKSVGHAVQDVAIAKLAVTLAKEKGLGGTLEL